MIERKTLGIRRDAPATGKAGLVATGARLEALKGRARAARRHPSDAQKALWAALSGSQLGGVKFSRQAVVGSTLVDFACPSRWIAVQLSPEGANADVDALQDRKLTEIGVRVLRFAEAEVLADIEPVLKAINAAVNQPFDKRSARKHAARRIEIVED